MHLIDRLGWMLLHSVWQIALIGCVHAMFSSQLRRRSANARYLAGCVALLLMAAAPAATFLWSVTPEHSSGDNALSQNEPAAPFHTPAAATPQEGRSHAVSSRETATTSGGGQSHPESLQPGGSRQQAMAGWFASRSALIRPALPWVVGLWLLGVLVLACRPALGLYTVGRLRRVGVSPASDELNNIVARISGRMGLRRSVIIVQSALAVIPMVVGALRPMLLLPASTLTNLSPRQLEAVLAHELAHVRRHDYLVNLLQTLVETMLFYHPAVWWVSGQVRTERENCCDDLAISIVGDRAGYAEMLLVLEQSCRAPQPAAAANGGSLLQRVRRIVAPEKSASSGQGSVFLGGVMLLIISCAIGLWLVNLDSNLIAAAPVPKPAEKPASKDDPKPAEVKNKDGGTGKVQKPDDGPRSAAIPEVDRLDGEGFAKLHRAAVGGHLDDVKALVNSGANVDVRQGKFKGAPLQYAAAQGHAEVVKFLIESQARVDSADTFGRTPLMWAATHGHLEVVQLLMNHGADRNARTNTGWTPLRYAIQSENVELIKFLKGQATLNELDGDGFSELHRAASGGHADRARILLDAGADVNVRQATFKGTPLQYAASSGHAEVVKLLLDRDAAIDATDSFGRTPLMWAAQAGHMDAVRVLLDRRANPHAKTQQGWTALRYAREGGHKAVADLLDKALTTDEGSSGDKP
jgi:ankyrin repeat protein/beta-lactamase regulating signal transducer with metallopeptidase domain